MSIDEFRERYGRSKKNRQRYNAAIRAEMVGGDDLLDAMELVNRLMTRLRERGLAGIEEAQQALDALDDLRELQCDLIRDKHGIR